MDNHHNNPALPPPQFASSSMHLYREPGPPPPPVNMSFQPPQHFQQQEMQPPMYQQQRPPPLFPDIFNEVSANMVVLASNRALSLFDQHLQQQPQSQQQMQQFPRGHHHQQQPQQYYEQEQQQQAVLLPSALSTQRRRQQPNPFSIFQKEFQALRRRVTEPAEQLRPAVVGFEQRRFVAEQHGHEFSTHLQEQQDQQGQGQQQVQQEVRQAFPRQLWEQHVQTVQQPLPTPQQAEQQQQPHQAVTELNGGGEQQEEPLDIMDLVEKEQPVVGTADEAPKFAVGTAFQTPDNRTKTNEIWRWLRYFRPEQQHGQPLTLTPELPIQNNCHEQEQQYFKQREQQQQHSPLLNFQIRRSNNSKSPIRSHRREPLSVSPRSSSYQQQRQHNQETPQKQRYRYGHHRHREHSGGSVVQRRSRSSSNSKNHRRRRASANDDGRSRSSAVNNNMSSSSRRVVHLRPSRFTPIVPDVGNVAATANANRARILEKNSFSTLMRFTEFCSKAHCQVLRRTLKLKESDLTLRDKELENARETMENLRLQMADLRKKEEELENGNQAKDNFIAEQGELMEEQRKQILKQQQREEQENADAAKKNALMQEQGKLFNEQLQTKEKQIEQLSKEKQEVVQKSESELAAKEQEKIANQKRLEEVEADNQKKKTMLGRAVTKIRTMDAQLKEQQKQANEQQQSFVTASAEQMRQKQARIDELEQAQGRALAQVEMLQRQIAETQEARKQIEELDREQKLAIVELLAQRNAKEEEQRRALAQVETLQRELADARATMTSALEAEAKYKQRQTEENKKQIEQLQNEREQANAQAVAQRNAKEAIEASFAEYRQRTSALMADMQAQLRAERENFQRAERIRNALQALQEAEPITANFITNNNAYNDSRSRDSGISLSSSFGTNSSSSASFSSLFSPIPGTNGGGQQQKHIPGTSTGGSAGNAAARRMPMDPGQPCCSSSLKSQSTVPSNADNNGNAVNSSSSMLDNAAVDGVGVAFAGEVFHDEKIYAKCPLKQEVPPSPSTNAAAANMPVVTIMEEAVAVPRCEAPPPPLKQVKKEEPRGEEEPKRQMPTTSNNKATTAAATQQKQQLGNNRNGNNKNGNATNGRKGNNAERENRPMTPPRPMLLRERKRKVDYHAQVQGKSPNRGGGVGDGGSAGTSAEENTKKKGKKG